MSDVYLGVGGMVGLDPHPGKHAKLYLAKVPEIGIALGNVGHDAAAAIVRDGRIVFAVEEERLNREKHFMGLPRRAVEACCEAAGVEADAVHLSHYLDPREEHLVRRKESCATLLDAAATAAVERDFADVQRRHREIYDVWPRAHVVDHHRAHAASAFYASGFERSLVLVIDAEGESSSTSVMLGDERGLTPIVQLPVTASLGLLYSAITEYLGFEPVEDEYKIMGLAAYGSTDEFRSFFDETIRFEADGAFAIPSVVEAPRGRLFKWMRKLGPPRLPNQPITDKHIAIACSLQRALERTVLRLLEHHEGILQTRALCIAGGVGLNCAMNGVIDRTRMFDRLFVQPAAGDSGAPLGAALAAYFDDHPNAPHVRMTDVYHGPSFDDAEVLRAIESFSDKVTWTKPSADRYAGEVAKRIAKGDVMGWFQGRMEYGPRALGNRSILGDPRRADMKDRINQIVKKREEFRPFAPSTTAEGADDFFELRAHEQYEYMTVAVRAKAARAAEIPSVVHVDGTARVHVVRKEVNPGYWDLIGTLGRETGVPVVLNTSFNVKGEPIVCTPEDAIRCYLGTGLDGLALQGYILSKTPENAS